MILTVRSMLWAVPTAYASCWCFQKDAYEEMWFLIIPPMMTFLDDYEIRYKVEGMRIVDAMLKKVPPDLLRKTGVTDLLFTVSPLHFAFSRLYSLLSANILSSLAFTGPYTVTHLPS